MRIVLHDRGRLLKLGWVIMPPALHLNIFQPELLLNAYTFLQTRHSSFLVTSSSGVVDTDLSLFPFIGRKVHQRAAPFIVFIVIIQAHTIIFIHGLDMSYVNGRETVVTCTIHSQYMKSKSLDEARVYWDWEELNFACKNMIKIDNVYEYALFLYINPWYGVNELYVSNFR